jgi:hypothetical protein
MFDNLTENGREAIELAQGGQRASCATTSRLLSQGTAQLAHFPHARPFWLACGGW